jgi:hypothetical protein
MSKLSTLIFSLGAESMEMIKWPATLNDRFDVRCRTYQRFLCWCSNMLNYASLYCRLSAAYWWSMAMPFLVVKIQVCFIEIPRCSNDMTLFVENSLLISHSSYDISSFFASTLIYIHLLLFKSSVCCHWRASYQWRMHGMSLCNNLNAACCN